LTAYRRDRLRCCQTHVLLPIRTVFSRQLIVTQEPKTTEIYTHVTTKGFDQIKSPLDTIGY